jgi:hypothetical protein
MWDNHRVSCNCGHNHANVLFKNNVLNLSVLTNIFCPNCSRNVNFDAESMLENNDWLLESDLVIPRGGCTVPISTPQI